MFVSCAVAGIKPSARGHKTFKFEFAMSILVNWPIKMETLEEYDSLVNFSGLGMETDMGGMSHRLL